MEMNKKIKVKKLSTGTVSYRIPGQQIARRWRGDNAIQMVGFEELQQCVYDPDIRTLFDYGYLLIDDKEARIELGIELEGDTTSTVDTTKMLVLDKAKVVQLLYDKKIDIKAFEEKVKRLAPETSTLLIEVATNTAEHAGYDRYDIIKKYFNVDVEDVKKSRREEAK